MLSRYMPKRKEVHLKKLIKGGEAEKEPEIQVHHLFIDLISGVENTAYCLILAFKLDTWNCNGR